MSDFDQAYNFLCINEGGYQKDGHDKGGATKYGLSANSGYLELAIKAGIVPNGTTIESITQEQVKETTKHFFWDSLNIGIIKSQALANKILDSVYSMQSYSNGGYCGIKCLQRAVRSYSNNESSLVEDGIFGQNTINEVNVAFTEPLLCAYRSEIAASRRLDYQRNQEYGEKYIKGWLNRAYK